MLVSVTLSRCGYFYARVSEWVSESERARERASERERKYAHSRIIIQFIDDLPKRICHQLTWVSSFLSFLKLNTNRSASGFLVLPGWKRSSDFWSRSCMQNHRPQNSSVHARHTFYLQPSYLEERLEITMTKTRVGFHRLSPWCFLPEARIQS